MFGDADKTEGTFKTAVELKNFEETLPIYSFEQDIELPIEDGKFRMNFENFIALQPDTPYTLFIHVEV